MTNPAVRNLALLIIACAVIVWGAFQIPGPAKYVPPPLPPHVLVMPHDQFLIAPGYGAYGSVLCNWGKYSDKPGGKAFNNWYILTCGEGPHAFSYTHKQRWSYETAG